MRQKSLYLNDVFSDLGSLGRRILPLLVLLSSFSGYSQLSQHVYGTTSLNEVTLSTAYVPGTTGGMIHAGYLTANPATTNSEEAYIFRTAENGQLLWSRRFDAPNAADRFNKVIVTANGEFVAVGYTQTTLPSNQVGYIPVICRYSATGAYLGSSQVRDMSPTNVRGNIYWGVYELANRNLVVVGAHDYRSGIVDALIASFDPALTHQWTRRYQAPNSNQFFGVTEFNNRLYVCGIVDPLHDRYQGIVAEINPTTGAVSNAVSNTMSYLHNTVNNVNMNCVWFEDLEVKNGTCMVTGSLSSDYDATQGNVHIGLRVDMATLGVAGEVIAAPFVLNQVGAFAAIGANEYLVVQNPGGSIAYNATSTAILNNDFILTRVSGGARIYTKTIVNPGAQGLYGLSVANNKCYLGGSTKNGTGQLGFADGYGVIADLGFQQSPRCSTTVDSVVVRPIAGTRFARTFTVTTPTEDFADIAQSTELSFQQNLLCGDDTTSTPCDDKCYWTLNGNGSVTPANFLGTTNNADLKIRTNNVQRAIIDVNGLMGINIASPATTLDVECAPTGSAPSGLLLENLPKGRGYVLVVDDAGYVYRASTTAERPSGEENEEIKILKAELAQLKEQVQALSKGTASGVTGASAVGMLLLHPNPNSGQFSVSYQVPSVENASVVIYDAAGRSVWSQILQVKQGEFKVTLPASLTSSSLNCTLRSQGKVVATQKLVLNR